ncbi:MAG: HD domain-containing protein [Acidobacteria bacterium]|nr:HD domain-containing protein [Acidobacteriota bacterium]
MAKSFHEIRDPIHVFVRLDSEERRVLDSRPFQRLRSIHQLALTYLVYPGATHKRFEHSLGVMELAGRVYDVVTDANNIERSIEDILPNEGHMRHYWRQVLRMAALCHDIGHLPFSHGAEKELLPAGWNHERLTWDLIFCPEMAGYWQEMKVQALDIAKLAVGPKKAAEFDTKVTFTAWEAILSEIIVGDAFGVDRMDYLLRDSYHAGVTYGRFDHYRLIDTLRILPAPPSDTAESTNEPALGVDIGGIQSSEALLLARYLMYSQMYMHHVRRIYDKHLQDFLSAWLPDGKFPTDVDSHLALTDNEVTAAMLTALRSKKAGEDPLSPLAKRVLCRSHFRLLYARSPDDVKINPESGEALYKAAQKEFPSDLIRHDRYSQKGGSPDFPVRMHDGRIVSSISLSDTLARLPVVSTDYIFADKQILSKADAWLQSSKAAIISEGGE